MTRLLSLLYLRRIAELCLLILQSHFSNLSVRSRLELETCRSPDKDRQTRNCHDSWDSHLPGAGRGPTGLPPPFYMNTRGGGIAYV